VEISATAEARRSVPLSASVSRAVLVICSPIPHRAEVLDSVAVNERVAESFSVQGPGSLTVQVKPSGQEIASVNVA
jgi:hypothetical protein